MFKKKINRGSDNNDNYKYSPSVTVPFAVSFEDENPKKMKRMRKEIERQEKEDPTNTKNIFCLLNKNTEKNLRKVQSSGSKSCISPEDDINASDPSLQFGHDMINTYREFGFTIQDEETGENIRPEYFTTNREIINFTHQPGILARFDPEFANLNRNGN